MYNLLRNKLNLFFCLFVTDSMRMSAIVQWENFNKISAVVIFVKDESNIITSEFERHYNEVLNPILNRDMKLLRNLL